MSSCEICLVNRGFLSAPNPLILDMAATFNMLSQVTDILIAGERCPRDPRRDPESFREARESDLVASRLPSTPCTGYARCTLYENVRFMPNYDSKKYTSARLELLLLRPRSLGLNSILILASDRILPNAQPRPENNI